MLVEWEEGTLDRLSDLYVGLPTPSEREVFARNVERINAQLALDPWSPGESRGPGRRVWFAQALVVEYELLSSGVVLVNHVVLLKDRLTDE